jgi:hypothetical protein
MARDFRTATIDDHKDLLDAVLASFERLQARLKHAESPELHALWNEPAGSAKPSPKEESLLSNVVHEWLQRDLGPNGRVILNREVQATRLGRLDIKIEALSPRRGASPLTLVVEVKGDWHREIAKSLGIQLAERYLMANGWTHGVYLVGWFGGQSQNTKRKAAWPPNTFATAQSVATSWQVAQCPPGLTIRAQVLDCRLSPLPKRSRRRADGARGSGS